MASFTPHTQDDIDAMLAAIGVNTIDDLFAAIPDALRLHDALQIPAGKSEFDVLADLEQLSGQNQRLTVFAGGGAYDHDIPSAVNKLTFRSEFVTAYTPYQAEVAQGVLQALFEFQTFVSRLFGMPIANASLYDGATALVEALNLACVEKSNTQVLMSDGIHPRWRAVTETYGQGTHHRIIPQSLNDGITQWSEGDDVGAVVVGYPNYYGVIDDIAQARAVADARNGLLIVVADVVSLSLLKSPGELGADVVIAEGQPFGTPMSFGGPYVGLIGVRENLVRRLPGRLIGETADTEGRRAFVSTLRTREQDIRREKASSNICTNQTLIAIAFAICASLLGTAGYAELGQRNVDGLTYLLNQLREVAGIVRAYNAPVVRECVVRLPIPAQTFIDALLTEGILAGIAVGENDLLVTATERRTKSEIDRYVELAAKVVNS